MGRERGLIGAAVKCIRRAVLRDVASDPFQQVKLGEELCTFTTGMYVLCSRRSLTARLIGICIIIYIYIIHTYLCMCLQEQERERGKK